MGSEMCIRDSDEAHVGALALAAHRVLGLRLDEALDLRPRAEVQRCLLYTSDAAAERSSVDLGGRRIIKQKTQCGIDSTQTSNKRRGDDADSRRTLNK